MVCSAQSPFTTGRQPFQTKDAHKYDTVNLTDLSVLIDIPIRQKGGSDPFSFHLIQQTGSYEGGPTGLSPLNETLTGNMVSPQQVRATFTVSTIGNCRTASTFSNWNIVDGSGAAHPVGPLNTGSPFEIDECTNLSATGTTADGSGYTVVASLTKQSDGDFSLAYTIYDRGGKNTIVPGTVFFPSPETAYITDTNGNTITRVQTWPNNNSASQNIQWTDATGTSPITADLFYFTDNAQPNPYTAYYPSTYTYQDSNGATQTYTINWTNLQWSPAGLGVCSGGYNIVRPFPTSLNLPDGTSFAFTYEQATFGIGTTTGRIATITLPTGGTISYNYSQAYNGVNCQDGSTESMTRTDADGVTTYVHTVSGCSSASNSNGVACNGQTTVTTADGNNLVESFVTGTIPCQVNCLTYVFVPGFPLQEQTYQGAVAPANLISSGIICYNNNLTNCATQTQITLPITQKDMYSYLPGVAQPSRLETIYNSSGLVTDEKHFDFGASSPASETVTQYGSYSGGTCSPIGNFINNRPCIVQVRDGSGNVLSQTNNGYDPKGNLLSSSQLVSGSTYLTRTFTHASNGALLSVTDYNNARTTFANNACNGVFPTSTTFPVSGLTTSATWDCNGGVVTSTTDMNGNVTNFSYDSMWRLATVQFPDGGKSSISYNLTASPPNVTTSQLIDSSARNFTTQTNFDGLGRPVRSILTSLPQYIYEDISYNNVGQVNCVFNPYQTSSDPTYGSTCYQYDALGRIKTVTNPDNTTKIITYAGRASEVMDEGNGSTRVSKIYQTDGLGRLASVCEVSANSQIGSGGTSSACGQDIAVGGFLTTYSYDVLGNLLSVTQPGLSGRSYSYDGLSRLTSEINPESGTTTYAYDSCSGGDLCAKTAPKPNQTSSSTITTSYAYDPLHRLTSKTYNDGTNNVYYEYDQIAPWGWPLSNPKGQLTEEYTANSLGTLTAQVLSYDKLGRVLVVGSCTPISCAGSGYGMHYTYDFLGDLLTEFNTLEGITYTNTYDNAARLTKYQSSLTTTGHVGTLFTVNQYNPLGEIQQATFGNGIVRNATYDHRGRITSQTDGSIYSFSLNLAADSNILSANDSVNGNWQYSYDDFNRLSASSETGVDRYSYAYDRFGNRWQQNGSYNPNYIFNGNNQILGSGVIYDAAGDVISDGLGNNYTYDAEGRLLTTGGPNGSETYVYDANGERVEEAVNGGAPIDFINDENGRFVTETTSTSWIRSELYAGGLHVATYDNGTTYFMHNDWLGSTKNQSNLAGASAQSCTDLPFGDAYNCPGANLSLMAFAGSEWDGAIGSLDHTLFREYNPIQGRWMVPDPSGTASADLTNPQSWNRYAYALNNPINNVDPLGLESSDGNCQLGDDGFLDCSISTEDDGGGGGSGETSWIGGPFNSFNGIPPGYSGWFNYGLSSAATNISDSSLKSSVADAGKAFGRTWMNYVVAPMNKVSRFEDDNPWVGLVPAALTFFDTGNGGPAEADLEAIEDELPSVPSLQETKVALGSGLGDVRALATKIGGTHFLDEPDWKEKVLAAIKDPSVTFHVSMKGFWGNDVQEMILNEIGSGSNTGWELQQIQQAGRLPGVNFYLELELKANPFL